jgi:protein SCO1
VSMSRNPNVTFFLLASVAAGLWIAPAFADRDTQGLRINPPKAIHARVLINQDGTTVTFPSTGKWQLAFFGFTACPDICPITMHKAAAALQLLGNRASQLEVVFLSIDSERDQPDILKKFVAAQDPRIQGLTGEAGAVQKVANEFGVIARRYQGKTALSYRIEHSSFLYLLDPQGRIVLMYPEKVSPDSVAADLERLWKVAAKDGP